MDKGFEPDMSENGPVKRRIDKQMLVVSAGVGVGLFLIISGLQSGSTGRDAQRLPVAIERMSPGPGDQVLQQSQILVDVIDGYEAELTVDGIDLPTTRLDELTENGQTPKPGAQVEIPSTAIYDPGNYTISFSPQQGAAITTLSQGIHTATVRYWKVLEGKNKMRSFTWKFEAN